MEKTHTRFYPHARDALVRTLLVDLVVLALLVFLAWLGLKVHDTVQELGALGRGVTGAGTAVEGGFGQVAEAVGGIPVIGGELSDAFSQAGSGTGGNVADLGREGEEAVNDLANLLGISTFLVPALLVLAIYVPPRLRQIRRVTAVDRLLAVPEGGLTGERRRLLAMRAAFSLPYPTLARHTSDPFGDLVAERYDSLVAAALEDAGLRPLGS
jgi:hypothetical protein